MGRSKNVELFEPFVLSSWRFGACRRSSFVELDGMGVRMRRVGCIVDQLHNGCTVATVLREQIGISRRVLRHTKYVEGAILVDGSPARSDLLVQAGQHVAVAIADKDVSVTESSVAPIRGAVDIRYEDEDVIVLNKPAHLVVHPRVGHTTDTLANYLAGYFAEQKNPCGIHPVHRLDQGTTGLVAFAKSGYAQAQLQRQLHQTFHRTYLALCHGWFEGDLTKSDARSDKGMPAVCQHDERFAEQAKIPECPEEALTKFGEKVTWHTIDASIGRSSGSACTRFEVRDDGKPSVTHFRILQELLLDGRPCSLVELRLETGRTHQIRVHMAHVSHPLLGDALYGDTVSNEIVELGSNPDASNSDTSSHGSIQQHTSLNRPALHAWRLEFLQPVTGDQITVEAELPDDMQALLLAGEFRNDALQSDSAPSDFASPCSLLVPDLASTDAISFAGSSQDFCTSEKGATVGRLEPRTYRLRYHHLMCLPRFIGEGYSGKFCENMASVRADLEQRGILRNGQIDVSQVELTDRTDDVCQACPNRLGPWCVSEPRVRRFDRGAKAQLESGTYPQPANICSDCSWYYICKDL